MLYEVITDTEWGVPEYDGRALWEKLQLDGMQAGLSWITILPGMLVEGGRAVMPFGVRNNFV